MSETPPDRDETPDEMDSSRPAPPPEDRAPWGIPPQPAPKPGPRPAPPPPPQYATEVVHVEDDAARVEDNDNDA